ncbi:hypothetical protein GCM10009665_69510 [Kitasatospora nipponensis]|uniref:DUF4139 domain-containing protein n=1 Tax=Kitasatospora nipponensis TaxID=258049 RepID=A0ABP4HQI9_9ACTN
MRKQSRLAQAKEDQLDHASDLSAAKPAPPGEPTAPAPLVPGADLLYYAGLVLAGPTEPAAQRGRLAPEPQPLARSGAQAADLVLPIPPHTVDPRGSAGSFDQRYDAEARADLPSDGGWHTVTLGEVTLALRPEYVCVPAVDPAVYATLRLTNDTGRALLAGPCEVTVDQEFLLTATLPTLAPGGSRRLGLGVAEGVRAVRRTETQESTAGLRGSTTVITERIRLELANRLSRAVTVEVRERIPVTAERDIRIEDRPGSPAWTPPSEPSDAYPAGTRLWRVELPPGGRAELDGGYEIRIPAGKALTGGNRRS